MKRGVFPPAIVPVETVLALLLCNLSHSKAYALPAKVYWTDKGTFKIQCANLNGTGVEDLIASGLSFPVAIALQTHPRTRNPLALGLRPGGAGVREEAQEGITKTSTILYKWAARQTR